MQQSILVDRDLKVKIIRFIQLSTPGVFDGCVSLEEKHERALFFSKLLKNDYGIDNVHIINSTIPNNDNLIACIITTSCSKPFKEYDGYHYELNIMWFQNDYAFPIDTEILKKISEIPFRKIATKDKNPF